MRKFIFQKPHHIDALILSIFTVLITLQPFFLHGRINLFETGLYLPGINAVFHGQVPFRDFFHLRGPFEIYMPAFLMSIFGKHIGVLYSYFYFGNILCLVLCVLIARELFKTRYIFYLFVPVLVGRTFPRVVFAIWGGMRYAFGLMAMLFLIKFFKRERPVWMFLAGIATSLGLLTSVEIGIYCIMGVGTALAFAAFAKVYDWRFILRSAGVYALGVLVVIVPYFVYLWSQQALMPYFDAVRTIVFRMQKVIDPHLVSTYPANLQEAVVAMLNPSSKNFRHMTPAYLYIVLLIYIIHRLRKRSFNSVDVFLCCLGAYGFIMYNTGFRAIWASQFEMALQPEKLIFFFILEVILLWALARKDVFLDGLTAGPAASKYKLSAKIFTVNAFALLLFFSSIGYSFQRYNHRFVAFKYVRDILSGKDTAHLRPGVSEEPRLLEIERARGLTVPADQAKELEQMDEFVKTHIGPEEVLFTYPELGIYNFFYDRPFVGRFPLVTFAWFSDQWHEEFVQDFMEQKPRYIVIDNSLKPDWYTVYLGYPPNRKKHEMMLREIENNYVLKLSTRSSKIYEIK